jgi:hypothetical protein
MGEERLCGLAMLHCSQIRDMNVSRRFDETGHRNIGTPLNDIAYLQIIPTIYGTLSYYSVEFISICFFH